MTSEILFQENTEIDSIVWNFPNKYYCECWKYKRNWQKTIGGFTSKM